MTKRLTVDTRDFGVLNPPKLFTRIAPFVFVVAMAACSSGNDKVEPVPSTPAATEVVAATDETPAVAAEPEISAVDQDLAALDSDLQVIDDALAELDTIAP